MEESIITSIRQCYPTSQIHFCLFHLLQAWRRKICQLSLGREIRAGTLTYWSNLFIFDTFSGGYFLATWNKMRALPFGSPSEIPYLFDIIYREAPTTNETQGIQ